ncbi:MAG: SDR family NAD(P)-dependent oxidoreductase [Rubellimicrobium sp.]|nr:SDR family NAD(P)-dependent oxidoreductase [Rubellimicrobium sp.]
MSKRVVLVTGASKGIGAATARAFAATGADLALVARGRAALEAVADGIGGNTLILPCDIADAGAVADAVARTLAAFGRLDVVISNAGVIEPVAGVADADAALWGRAVDVNLKGVFHLARAALPPMIAGGGGSFLHVSSGAAHAPREGWSAYCASKAGAAMLMQSIHLEHAAQGIRALSLSPGTVATDMQRTIAASGMNDISRLPWSAHVPPEWPAMALLWMAGADADDFLGQELSLREEWLRQALGLMPVE